MLRSTIFARPNLEVELNRRMINHLTEYLAKKQSNVEGVLFDLDQEKIVVTAIFNSQNFKMLEWLKPTLSPGEIFLSSGQRSGQASRTDEKDFVVAIQLRLNLRTEVSAPDTVYLSFSQPRVAAYYKQDLLAFKDKQRQLGVVLTQYDSAKAQLTDINRKLGSSSEVEINHQLKLTSQKIQIRKRLNQLAGDLDVLNRQIIRFSGSYLSVLPSDKLLQELITSSTGNLTGDSIIREAYGRVMNMEVLNRQLKIDLVDGIKNRSGVIKVSNLGGALSGVMPALKINKIKITNKLSEAHEKSGLITGNFIIRLEADTFDLKGGRK